MGSSPCFCDVALAVASPPPQGDRHGLLRLGLGQHVASPLEDPTWLNDQAWGVQLTVYDALGQNFDPRFRSNRPVEPTRDRYLIRLNLPFHLSLLAQHQRLLTTDGAFNIAIDAERPGQIQSAFQ